MLGRRVGARLRHNIVSNRPRRKEQLQAATQATDNEKDSIGSEFRVSTADRIH
jgi:hypothetical protein